ncbi:lasso RiPP family leader peptide-containing protein [Streptomyces hydrogenans]
MTQQITEVEIVTPAYEAPVVIAVGTVAEVTLGTQSFDTADDTQYKH